MGKIKDLKGIVQRYKDNGIVLWTNDGELHFKALKDGITEDQIEFLKTNKAELVEVLEQEPANEFALTDIQSAYLVGRLESFDYGGVSCKVYLEMEYDELDLNKSTEIWNQLIKRHEMLRAIIREDGYQMIQSEAPAFKIDYFDLTNDVDSSEELTKIRDEKSSKNFEIGSWPFFDISISRLIDRSIMHIAFDFLIADWASITLLLAEFETLYKNPQTELKTPELTFQQYLALEDELKNSNKYIESRKYWIDRIDTLPAQPVLPILDKDKTENSFDRLLFTLSTEEWSHLKKIAQQHGCTPTSIVMSVYALTLSRWSQNQKFCLNITLLNREPLHKDINKIVGDFTSVNLLELDLTQTETFIDHAKKIQSQIFSDLEHREFSGVKVIREITKKKGKEAAFFPFVFTSSIGVVQSGTITGKFGGFGISQTPQVFIDCQAMDGNFGLRLNWDVRRGVFNEGFIAEMFASFKAAVYGLLKDESVWKEKNLITLPVSQAETRTRVNNTQLALPKSGLHEPVFEQIKNKENNTAVIDASGKTSYKELGIKARQIAFSLKNTGCKQGDKVAVIIPKEVNQLASVLGVLQIGAVYVPIDDMQPVNRVRSIIESINISHVLTLSSYTTDEIDADNIVLVDTITSDSEQEKEVYRPQSDDLAYVIFTSGSTGVPKGVQISHGAVSNTVQDINQRFDVNDTDRVLSISKLNFDLSVYDIFGLLSAGGTVVLPDDKHYLDPSYWYEYIEKHSISIWNTVPAFMQMLLTYLGRDEAYELPIRLVMLSGDWVPVTMPNDIWKYSSQAEVVALGGATEASIWSNYHICRRNHEYTSSIPYGYPLANQEYRVVNQAMEDCPEWVLGELCIVGDGVAAGYINNEEATKKQFFKDPVTGKACYKTGDYGYYVPNGEIIFHGRKDEQVKISGHRIELGEVESTLNRHEKVNNAAVIFYNKNLYSIITSSSDVDLDEIKDFLNKNLPDYMIPRAIKIVDEIPLATNGKIDRKEIAELFKDGILGSNESNEDDGEQAELEKVMTEMLYEILGVPNIKKTTDLYNIGADSLILAQFIGKLKDHLDQLYPDNTLSYDNLLRQILNHPVISRLNKYIETNLYSNDSEGDNEAGEKGKNIGQLINLGGGEKGPARIIFHAGMGTLNCFKLLIDELVPQNLGPVIGISVQDVDKYLAIDSEDLVETLADEYTKLITEADIKEVQLIGYCLGGLIAVEVASRLVMAGVNIVDFTLIDSAPSVLDLDLTVAYELLVLPNFYVTVEDIYEGITHQELTEAINYAVGQGATLTDEDILNYSKSSDHQEVFEHLKKFAEIPKEQRFIDYTAAMHKKTGEQVPVDILKGNIEVIYHSFKGAKLKTAAYFGDIRFLEAMEKLEISGDMPENAQSISSFWTDVCVGNFDIIEVRGDHITCIEEREKAREVADILGKPLIQPSSNVA